MQIKFLTQLKYSSVYHQHDGAKQWKSSSPVLAHLPATHPESALPLL